MLRPSHLLQYAATGAGDKFTKLQNRNDISREHRHQAKGCVETQKPCFGYGQQ